MMILPTFLQALTVYSYRHYESDQALFKQFTASSGIPVHVVKAKADTLLERLKAEGQNSPADILLTSDAARLHAAQQANLLLPVTSQLLTQRIPAHLRDPASTWFGFTQRARVIVYHPDRVSLDELNSYEALADPVWKGRILVRSSANIYNQSLMASMIEAGGDRAALSWAKGVVANMARPPQGSDRDQMRALARGLGDVAIVNTYYVGLMQNSKNPQDRAVAAALKVFFPNQTGRGSHINISGAGVTRSSQQPAAAIKLLEFLVSEYAQRNFPAASYEYPVVEGVAWSQLQQDWGQFKSDTISLKSLGQHNLSAVKLLTQAGWR